jgi:cysteine desulfurase family protein
MGVYLDNAATTYPKPESVYTAVEHFLRHVGGSPGRGGHRREEEADRIVWDARRAVAQLVNAPDESGVIFTMNATQAINLGLKGLLRPGDHVITSALEHNGVWRPLKTLEHRGHISLSVVPCDAAGQFDPDDVLPLIRSNTRLIVMIHASNVLGTILPVPEVGRIAREHELYFIVDAAQTAGAYPVDMEEMHIDLLAFAGHKGTFGPHGTGGLVVRPGIDLATLIEGGTGGQSELETQPDELPQHLESGTSNALGIAGLLAGVGFVLQEGVESIRAHEMALTGHLLASLRDMPEVVIYGPDDVERQVGVISITINGFDPTQLAVVLDEMFDIAVRAGLHCAPQAHRAAGTLECGTVRLSPGYLNTPEDIDDVISALLAIIESGT